MNAVLILLALIFLMTGTGMALVCLIRRLMHRPTKQIGQMAGGLLLSSLLLIVVFVLQVTVDTNRKTQNVIQEDGPKSEPVIQTELDFVVEDGAEPIEVPLTNGFEERENDLIHCYQIAYDAEKYPLLPVETGVTTDMCKTAIQESGTISREMKEYFLDFVQRIGEKYPNADLTALYQNLQTLEVKEADTMDMFFKTHSTSAYACYVNAENAIYLPPGISFMEGEWDYQVLLHEFCHVVRGTKFKEEEDTIQITYCTDLSRTILEEAMNSVFSCSLLNYYEPDIAYQMPSNYLRIMLECMDYDLTDYINHNDCYFLRQLDLYAGYINYAEVIWKLINLQREDWQDDAIDIAPERYEPIYDFLCELYFDRYLTEDMSDEEAMELAEELAEKAGYDCPEDYKFEPDYFTAAMTKLLAARG